MKRLLILLLAGSVLMFSACRPESPASSADSSVRDPHSIDSKEEEKIAVINMDDLGAVPDGKTDSTPAIAKLLSKLRTTVGKKRVMFSEGTYRFSGMDYGCVFTLNGIANTEFVGAGMEKTTLIVTNPKSGLLQATACMGISLKEFSVDWDPLPFTQGVIVAKDEAKGTFDVQLDEGYPSPMDTWFQEGAWDDRAEGARWGVLIDRDTNTFKDGVQDTVFVSADVTDLTARTYRFQAIQHGVAGVRNDMEVGDRYAQIIRSGQPGAVGFTNCCDTLVENVALYASSGFGIVNINTENSAVVRGIKILCREGRAISLPGDGIHFTRARCAPLVENCTLEGTCDDGVSLWSVPPIPTIMGVISDTQLLIHPENNNTRVGDTFSVYNPREGKIVGQSTIINIEQSVDDNGNNALSITFDPPIPGVTVTGTAGTTDQFANLNACSAGITVRGCTFGKQRVRQVFLSTTDVVVENNAFDGAGSHAVAVLNEAVTAHGITPNKVIVRNNTISRSGYNKKVFDMYGGIVIAGLRYPQAGEQSYTSAMGHPVTQVEITGNIIRDSYGSAIYLGGVMTASVNDNKIETSPEFSGEQLPLMVFDNCTDISVKDNIVNDPRPTLPAVFSIRGNSDPGKRGVIDEGNTVEAATKTIWEDLR